MAWAEVMPASRFSNACPSAASRSSAGRAIVNLLNLSEGEQIADELLHASGAVEGAGNIAQRLNIQLVREAVLEELDVTPDGPQRFLQVV